MEVDKRVRILNAASELIVQNGLQCSMAAVAERAGVATGSLYNYFPSKEAMIRAVYERLATSIELALCEPDQGRQGARARIEGYIRDYIELIWQDADRALLFEYLSNVPLIPPAEMAQAFRRVSAHTAELMEAGKAEGLLKAYPTNLMGALIGGAVRNTLKWHRIYSRDLTDGDRAAIATMCWTAIAA